MVFLGKLILRLVVYQQNSYNCSKGGIPVRLCRTWAV